MKKRYFCLAGVVLVLAVFVIVTVSNNSSRALRNEDNRIALFADAYGVMIESLTNANLLPEYGAAEFLEENLRYDLSLENMEVLACKLEDMYKYSFSITYGHNWVTTPKSDDCARIYLFISPDYNGLNKVKIEGFLNDHTNPVDMYYTYRNGSWVLVRAEVLYPDWSKETDMGIS